MSTEKKLKSLKNHIFKGGAQKQNVVASRSDSTEHHHKDVSNEYKLKSNIENKYIAMRL